MIGVCFGKVYFGFWLVEDDVDWERWLFLDSVNDSSDVFWKGIKFGNN